MKLELKHICGYLPYGLKMELLDFPLGKHIRTLELDCGHDFHYYLQNNKVRPLLRPLSDLTKEITHKGETFVPFEEIHKDGNFCDVWGDWVEHLEEEGVSSNVLACPYDLMQMFFEWHFDVFGLIDEGLAVDVNTLEDNPYE